LDVETLTAAERRRLEQALLAGTPPDFEQLTKYVYCGWNHDLLGRLLGESFGTAFAEGTGATPATTRFSTGIVKATAASGR
jgi:hypothetical protein